MRETELAISFAITLAKNRNIAEVTPDELLLGCLRTVSQFGIVRLGSVTLDLEALGMDWLQDSEKEKAKVAYSEAVVSLFDQAARIAKADGFVNVRVEHLLAAFAGENSGLMAQLKVEHRITSATWRTAIAELWSMATREPTREKMATQDRVTPLRDYLSPEDAAEALGIHAQTVRAYVRNGKLPAMRLAGERAIRIRRTDLEKVLEPLTPPK